MEIASITSTLAPLALLACPVGMGVMMWMMMRGGKRDLNGSQEAPQEAAQPASLEGLREEQRRLAEEIEQLEQHSSEQAWSTEPVGERR